MLNSFLACRNWQNLQMMQAFCVPPSVSVGESMTWRDAARCGKPRCKKNRQWFDASPLGGRGATCSALSVPSVQPSRAQRTVVSGRLIGVGAALTEASLCREASAASMSWPAPEISIVPARSAPASWPAMTASSTAQYNGNELAGPSRLGRPAGRERATQPRTRIQDHS